MNFVDGELAEKKVRGRRNNSCFHPGGIQLAALGSDSVYG
jgi:hypothetical protein